MIHHCHLSLGYIPLSFSPCVILTWQNSHFVPSSYLPVLCACSCEGDCGWGCSHPNCSSQIQDLRWALHDAQGSSRIFLVRWLSSSVSILILCYLPCFSFQWDHGELPQIPSRTSIYLPAVVLPFSYSRWIVFASSWGHLCTWPSCTIRNVASPIPYSSSCIISFSSPLDHFHHPTSCYSPVWKKDSLNPSSHPTYYLFSLPPFLAVFFTGVVYINSLIFPHSFFAIVFDPLHAFRTDFVQITGNPVLLSCIILYCVTWPISNTWYSFITFSLKYLLPLISEHTIHFWVPSTLPSFFFSSSFVGSFLSLWHYNLGELRAQSLGFSFVSILALLW